VLILSIALSLHIPKVAGVVVNNAPGVTIIDAEVLGKGGDRGLIAQGMYHMTG
jgi:hypothetical protein